MSMITASTWVPRGAAAAHPTRYDIDEKELARISKLAQLQLDDAKEDLENARNGSKDVGQTEDSSEGEESGVRLPRSQGYGTFNMDVKKYALIYARRDVDDDLKEYDLDHYDSDDLDENGEPLAIFGNARSLAYHESNADDPYLTLEDEEDDEEREELQVLATDNMLVTAKVEDEVAHLEVYVYEDEADNLYVHHDIMLPAIPLCVEWLDLPVGKEMSNSDMRANYVAVGTFDPDIEIWDLDTVDCMYPNAILGQISDDGNANTSGTLVRNDKKQKRKKSKKSNDSYHVDAVLSLAANRQHRNLLASSSADKTVKLWDLNTTKCAKSYSHHTDKVCSIAWNPKESTVLLSGSYDRTVVAADMRAPDAKVYRWGVESDVETVMWNPHDSNLFYVTTENGLIHYHDIRTAPSSPEASKPVWKLQAHDQSISSFDVNPAIPGFFATGSTDKDVKLWNVQANGPSLVVSRNLGVGKIFSVKFAPDSEVAFRLAVAGSKGVVQVWDTSTNAAVRRIFASRLAPIEGDIPDRTVTIKDDSSDSEVEGGAESGRRDIDEKGVLESMDED